MADQKAVFSLGFKNKPQINISTPSTARMWLIALCAFACVLQSASGDNGQSLTIALTAFFTAIIMELLFTFGKKGFSCVADGSAAATAMIISLLMPNQIHPAYAALAAAFAIVVVKYSFGGLGSNWFNPALGGWLFARFSWSSAFNEALQGSIYSTAEMFVTSDVSAIDTSVTTFFNDTVFSVAGVQLPSGYINLLFSNSPGLIADRGLFALLIGTVVITALGINRGWIPLAFLAVYGFLIRFAADASGIFWNGDLLFGLFSGGTILAAFILAAEPASSAKLKFGVLLAVVLGAVLSWFFRYRAMDYTGCFTAIALVNSITPLIRLFEEKFFIFKSRRAAVSESLL